jgi:hypothetical protein
MSNTTLSDKAISELYSFIVSTNNEFALCNQCKNPRIRKELEAYFQIMEE